MNAARTAKQIAEECLGYRMRMLGRVVSRLYDDELRPHGVRFSQMNILTTIVLKGPVQAVEIGRVLALEKSTLSRNLRVLEANGWISREPAETGVGQRLRITPEGERVFVEAASAWRRAQRRVVELVGGTAEQAIRRAVDRVRAD